MPPHHTPATTSNYAQPQPAGRTMPLVIGLALSATLAGCNVTSTILGDRSNRPREARSEQAQPRMSNDDFAEAALENAQSLRMQGMYEEALRELERAIALNPQMPPAYVEAGKIQFQLGDYKGAEERYRTAVGLAPRSFDANFGLGLVLQVTSRFAEAVRSYLAALTIRPDDFEANKNLGTTYLQMDEPSQGLPYAQRAVEIDPRSGAARVNLGAVYAAMGNHAAAVVEYQQAAELMELSPELLLNLAESLRALNRDDEVLNTLRQLVAVSPSPVAYERLGAAMFRQRQYDTAHEQFLRALELDPNHYPALNGLGVYKLNVFLWSEKKDREALNEAIRAFRRSLQIEPDQPRIVELISRYS